MGQIHYPRAVQLFCGLLSPVEFMDCVNERVEAVWGPVQGRSEAHPFHYSDYYADELGHELMRWFVVFQKRIDQSDIREIKLQSNKIELSGAVEGKRRYNVDPGFIDLDKVVLATTKPATYRIYLGDGIFAQSTLFFKDAHFHPWSWTYADYRDDWTILFFEKIRSEFKTGMKR